MGWIVETAIDWIWTDVIYAIYKRYGWIAAAAALLAPFILIGLLIALVVAIT